MEQKQKSKHWRDEKGNNVPISRITRSEKIKEKYATKLLNEAKKINSALGAYKELISKLCNEAYQETLKDLDSTPKKTKGYYTWHNFDRSIKIEVSVSDRISFDDITIMACKDKLDEYLDVTIESKDEFAKELITDAFEKTNGQLDANQVMPLLRFRKKIKHKLYQEAMDLLEQSIRRPDSKTYFRIYQRDTTGSYQNVQLNFSAV